MSIWASAVPSAHHVWRPHRTSRLTGVCGDRRSSESTNATAATHKVILASFYLGPQYIREPAPPHPLVRALLHLTDRVATLQLPAGLRALCERHRVAVAEERHRASHEQRQARLQALKDEKTRKERERVAALGAEARAKWEEREQRRLMKKRMSKATLVVR